MDNNQGIQGQVASYLYYCEHVRGMSRQTMKAKEWVLGRFIKEVGIDDLEHITNSHINDWIAAQTSRGVSGRTINTRICHLVSMFKWHRDMGMTLPGLKISLILKVREESPRRKYYTREQIDQVLLYADNLAWILIKLCFDCGLRISELQRLRLSNLNGCAIRFVGKGGKSRTAFMSEEARNCLDDWIIHNDIVDFLWVRDGVENKPLCVEQIRRIMRVPFRLAGFKDFYPHALRHSFATDIQRNGANLMEVKEMLGHARAETTERYIHGLDGQLESLYKKYRVGSVKKRIERDDLASAIGLLIKEVKQLKGAVGGALPLNTIEV